MVTASGAKTRPTTREALRGSASSNMARAPTILAEAGKVLHYPQHRDRKNPMPGAATAKEAARDELLSKRAPAILDECL